MKVFGKLLRSVLAPVFGVAAMGVLLTGCGDATDPTAVGLDELKFSNGLSIVDQGNGTVRLYWSGSNNEDDFSGYNIYGAKGESLVAKEGQTIKLLDDKGEEDASGKATLGTMGYNGTDWETPGPSTNPDGDFSVYPYYTTKNGEDAVLPSCMPNKNEGADSVCTPLTAEGGASHIFNGVTQIDLKGLKIGSTYCFTTLATLDDGKKVAQTTSEIRCVVPRASVDATATAQGNGTDGSTTKKAFALDLEALRKACGEAGGTTCGTLAVDKDLRATPATAFTDESSDFEAFMADEDTKGCNPTTPYALCVEYFSSKPNFTAGKNTGIQDLGYYPAGFQDDTLPPSPKLSSFGELQNKDGFSVSGQSLPIEANHVYVVANATDAAATTPSSFYYHYIYVGEITNNAVTGTATFPITVRVSNKADSL